MKFINLTPHTVKVCAEALDGGWVPVLILDPSRPPVRCSMIFEEIWKLSHTDSRGNQYGPFPIFTSKRGGVSYLPPEEDDTGYIVSTLVREACPHRLDLYSPGELIRGEDGQPIGCKGLVSNV